MTLVVGAVAFAAALLLLYAAAAGYAAYQRYFTRHARSRLEEAFLFIDPNKVFVLSIVGVVVIPPLIWLLTGNIALPVLGGVLTIVMPRIAFAVINLRRRKKMVLQLPETLDQLARTLRSKATMEGKIRSLTSQGKLQGLIVGLLPIFLMLVLSRMQHDAMQPLFHSIIGWGVLGVIGVLEMIGFFMIRKIVTIDV